MSVPAADRPHAVTVGSVMVTRLYVATPNWTLREAATAMRAHFVSGLPVVDATGALVGVVSERDILLELDRAAGIGRARGLLELLLELEGDPVSRLDQCLRRLDRGRVGEVMSRRIVTTDPETSIGEAARLMRQYSIHRLPVVSGGRLVGIVTHANIVATLAEPMLVLTKPEGPWSRHHLSAPSAPPVRLDPA